MNTKLVDSLVQIIKSLIEEERKSLEEKLHPQIKATEMNTLNFKDEPFIGMWRDQKEMKNSVQWVRNLRQQEWMS